MLRPPREAFSQGDVVLEVNCTRFDDGNKSTPDDVTLKMREAKWSKDLAPLLKGWCGYGTQWQDIGLHLDEGTHYNHCYRKSHV
jgi:hypothetical protein